MGVGRPREEILFRNLMLLDASALAANALASEGIPAVLYKGCAYFDSLLPLDARRCSDADFLVPDGLNQRARRSLARAGFDVHETQSARRRAHPAGAVIAPNGCAIDLHDALAQPGRFPVPNDVFANAVRMKRTAAVYRMSDPDLLLAAVANLAKDELTADKSRLNEFAHLCEVVIQTDGDAAKLWERARQWNLRPALKAVIFWAVAYGECSNHGMEKLDSVSKINPLRRHLLKKAFDFSSAVPLRGVRNRRVRQAVGLPLLTGRITALFPGTSRFIVASAADLLSRSSRTEHVVER